jgi:hypothetical protein
MDREIVQDDGLPWAQQGGEEVLDEPIEHRAGGRPRHGDEGGDPGGSEHREQRHIRAVIPGSGPVGPLATGGS